jgi:TetR/AcrR family transcriptional repressor of nem operon
MGISHGSLYNAFGDKYTLYLAALDQYIENYLSQFAKNLQKPGSVKENITGLFNQLTSVVCIESNKKGCFMANSAVELAAHDPQVAQRVESSNEKSEEALYQALCRAQQEGEISPGKNLHSLARLLNTTVSGIRVRSKSNPKPEVLQDIVHTTLSFVFDK